MSGPEAGIEDAPLTERQLGTRLKHVFSNRRRDGVEMARAKECRAVTQLRRTVATRSRTASSTAQEIDIALAGAIEAMAIAADERASRNG